MEKGCNVIIVGNIGLETCQTFHNLAIGEGGKLVHINQFEPEPIQYIKPPLIEEKINYDKYGKILTNKGSKFHK